MKKRAPIEDLKDEVSAVQDETKSKSTSDDEDISNTKKTKPPKIDKSLIKPLVAIVISILLILVILKFVGGGTTAKIGNTSLYDIQTYLSKGSSDQEKKVQKNFKIDDPIQIGIKYNNGQEDTLVKFIVVKRDSGEEAFTTNYFRLQDTNGDGDDDQLFISINNTSLDPGDYTVKLVDRDGNHVASVDYSIQEK